MTTKKNIARLAGFLYLIVIVCGTLYLQYIPAKIKLKANPEAVANRIKDVESLFKVGILSELVCWVAFLILSIILFRLLKEVNKTGGILMLFLAVVQVPLSFANLSNKLVALSLVNDAPYKSFFTPSELNAQVLLHLDLYRQGVFINQIFWGGWLLPFGYLVYKSKFMPKILGVFLIAGCVGYLIDFLGSFLYPDYSKTVISDYMILPASLGEIGICIWLLIFGIKDRKDLHEQLSSTNHG